MAKQEKQPQEVSELELLQEKNAALEAALEDAATEIESLKKQLAQAGQKPTPSVSTASTFTVDNKEYRFLVVEFRYNGEIYTAAKAVKDATLLKELVDNEIGFIEAV